ASDGWLGVKSVEGLKPGDLIAWESPKFEEHHKGNSGHVMMVAGEVGAIKSETVEGQAIRFVGVPVIDSSSVRHFPPEQLPPQAHQTGRDGVGKGVVRIILDERNRPIGYWEGTYWSEGDKPIRKPTMTDSVSFGRLVGLSQH